MTAEKDSWSEGRIVWEAGMMAVTTIIEKYFSGEKWGDGFVAFSSGEVRLAALGGAEALVDPLQGRHKKTGLEGFLMEAGLWRHDTGTHEELSLEREGDDFFVQYWRLSTGTDQPDGQRCHFREATTFVRGNMHQLFSETAIATFEVIVPQDRLRFYLTRGVD